MAPSPAPAPPTKSTLPPPTARTPSSAATAAHPPRDQVIILCVYATRISSSKSASLHIAPATETLLSPSAACHGPPVARDRSRSNSTSYRNRGIAAMERIIRSTCSKLMVPCQLSWWNVDSLTRSLIRTFELPIRSDVHQSGLIFINQLICESTMRLRFRISR